MSAPPPAGHAPLPIDAVLPAIADALGAHASAVLEAPPGAGKTTRVPLALLDEPWLAGETIVMLEPRRLAARAAARHMAALLGEEVGGRVGYRVRLDTRVSRRTRVEVVTEGVLTRMLQHDASLDGIGLVVFDEFHERSLASDLGLALTLETQSVLRPELRVLVMSATIEGDRVAALLGGAPVVRSEGRSFPVETRYVERRADAWVEPQVAALVRRALDEQDGDLLVFLPGAAEIRRVHALLAGAGLPQGVRLAPLYGNLSPAEQDAAIRPAPPGSRKVVLATSIAETSLTIEGVRVVVDAGLARVPRFSPRTGMTRLETVRVSRASADQRRGRAGRLAPGVCYRLWAEPEHHHLVAFAAPEIRDADLAPLALELAAAGVAANALRWLDAPPEAAMAQARELLGQLGALGVDGRITPHGRRMADLGLHPRLAHMAIHGESFGAAGLACDLAALLSERDVLRTEPGAPGDADVGLRLELLRAAPGVGRAAARGMVVDEDALRRVRAEAGEWRRQLGVRGAAPDDASAAGVLLALAYPDRIGRRRADAPGRFVLRNGLGARLDPGQRLAEAEFIVAAELDGRRPESRVYLAAPLSLGEIERHVGEQIERETVVAWDDDIRAVRARRQERLGAIVLVDAPARDADPAAIANALLAYIRREGIGVLAWSDAARRLQQRVAFLRRLAPARWPDLADAALLVSSGEWLAPHLAGVRRADELARVDVVAAMLARLDWEQRAALDADAPTHVQVPSGSRVPIDYGDPSAPVLAVRLQELFGLAATPAVAGGRVPLTLHLLSPAHRPVQVTSDLAGFWRSSYFDVRKELRGRYPKHHWPDDPLSAPATNRAKRRGE